jgi:hypothetical protein
MQLHIFISHATALDRTYPHFRLERPKFLESCYKIRVNLCLDPLFIVLQVLQRIIALDVMLQRIIALALLLDWNGRNSWN